MSKKQWGSFPEAFGSDDKLFTGGQLAKAVDPDDINLEGMREALEVLNCRAKKMSKSQLHRLNYKLGLAVNKFKEGVQKYLHQRWENNMNSGTLEKVHRGNGDMSDSGLDERRENVIPQVGTPHKFTKATGGDMGDPFGDDEAK